MGKVDYDYIVVTKQGGLGYTISSSPIGFPVRVFKMPFNFLHCKLFTAQHAPTYVSCCKSNSNFYSNFTRNVLFVYYIQYTFCLNGSGSFYREATASLISLPLCQMLRTGFLWRTDIETPFGLCCYWRVRFLILLLLNVKTRNETTGIVSKSSGAIWRVQRRGEARKKSIEQLPIINSRSSAAV